MMHRYYYNNNTFGIRSCDQRIVFLSHQWAKPRNERKITWKWFSRASATSGGGSCGCACGYPCSSSQWLGTPWGSCSWRLPSTPGAGGQQPCRTSQMSSGVTSVSPLHRRGSRDTTHAQCMTSTTPRSLILGHPPITALSRVWTGNMIDLSSKKPLWPRSESVPYL
jgi:hypothetical protein